MKQMRVDLNKSSSSNKHGNGNSSSGKSFGFGHKNNQFVVKLAVCFLLVGLVYRLSSSTFIQFSPVVDTQADATFPVEEASPPPVPNSGDLAFNQSQTSFDVAETCDIFSGTWVPDSSDPLYTNRTCFSIEDHQNCIKNGRPDTGYLHWRWVPRDCELPKFNPKRFLDLMRNKYMAFIGDSISRNHVQSLICILSQAERAVEVYHDKEYKSKRWSFPIHNVTVSVIWTPFLVKAAIFEDNDGVSSDVVQLYLDQLDPVWAEQYNDFDYAVIGGGKWFLKTAIYHENNTVIGCHNCQGENSTELGFDHAYRKALQLVFNFITSSTHKGFVFFRTSTPDHFENGEWNTGGYCNRSRPFTEGEIALVDVDRVMRDIELEEFGEAVARESDMGLRLKLFDTTGLSLLRPDGHPGAYRTFHPFAGKAKNAKVQNDCLHWCLPGPIDSWNDLMMAMLLNDRRS